MKLITVLQEFKRLTKSDFIVVGGAAVSLYTGGSVKDIDLVMGDYGDLHVHSPGFKLIEQFTSMNVDHDGVVRGLRFQAYRFDLIPAHQVHLTSFSEFSFDDTIFDNAVNISGVRVSSIPDLFNKSKSSKHFFSLIKKKKLGLDFMKKIKTEQKRREFLVDWEIINNKELLLEEARKRIRGW